MADRTVTYVFRGDIGDLRAKVAAAGQSVAKLGNDLTAADKSAVKFRAGMTTVGNTAGKMGLVAAAGLGMVVKSAMDWESAWAGVTKTVDGSAAQLGVLEGQLRDLAKVLPASHQEIAAVAEAAGQLGVQRDSIASFTKTMIDLGETTNLSADEAATAIAQLANVMGTAPEDIDNLGSALVALGNDGASTERQIILMAQRIAGAGAQIGLTEQNILAISNATASMGIEVEAGGTAISQTFTMMAKSVSQGGEKLEGFAQIAGMSADAFANMFGEDPAAAFAAFTTGLDRINKSGGDVFTALEGVKLSGIRVSSTLLSLAAAGDMVTKSNEVSSQAWSENTALADEAAKRYETSSAQIKIAWNNIKDASIEFGAAALPILAKAAGGVSNLASAVGNLPGPVKSATAGLLGVTAVFGGGLWFSAKAINGVADMRTALTNLGMSANTSRRALAGLGVAGVTLGALVVASEAIDAIWRASDRAAPGVQRLTQELLNMGDANVAAKLGRDLGDVGAALDRLNSAGGMDAFFDSATGLFDKIPVVGEAFGTMSLHLAGLGSSSQQSAREVREAEAAFARIDETLAGIVTAGSADQAKEVLENLATAYGLTADQQKQLVALMPQYQEALAGSANAADLAAGANTAAAGAYGEAGDAAGDASVDIDKLREAMQDQRSAAIGAFNAQTRYAEALANSKKAIEDNGKTLDKNTPKGRANRDVLSAQAAAWNDLSDKAKNADGAHRNAVDAFVATAVAMGKDEKAARLLARQLLEIKPKSVKVTAETDPARQAIETLLADMSGRTIGIGVRVTAPQVDYSGIFGPKRAYGGEIPGSSPNKRSDNILIAATAGEYMQQVDAVNYYGLSVMDAINNRRIPKSALTGYAYGGEIGGVSGYATGGEVLTAKEHRGLMGDIKITVDMDTSQVRAELRDFAKGIRDAGGHVGAGFDDLKTRLIASSKELDGQRKALEGSKDALKSMREDAKAFSTSVADLFKSDLFGTRPDTLPGVPDWVTGDLREKMMANAARDTAGDRITSQLEADAKRARDYEAALREADRKGLNGGIFRELAGSGDLESAQGLAGMSRKELRRIEQLYAQRAQFAGSVGQFARQESFGPEIKHLAGKVDQLGDAVKALTDDRRGMVVSAKSGDRLASAIGRETGKALNKTAAAAQRSK